MCHAPEILINSSRLGGVTSVPKHTAHLFLMALTNIVHMSPPALRIGQPRHEFCAQACGAVQTIPETYSEATETSSSCCCALVQCKKLCCTMVCHIACYHAHVTCKSIAIDYVNQVVVPLRCWVGRLRWNMCVPGPIEVCVLGIMFNNSATYNHCYI